VFAGVETEATVGEITGLQPVSLLVAAAGSKSGLSGSRHTLLATAILLQGSQRRDPHSPYSSVKEAFTLHPQSVGN
jgi:hypothetical protein